MARLWASGLLLLWAALASAPHGLLAASGPVVKLAQPSARKFTCPNGKLRKCDSSALCAATTCAVGERCVESYCGQCRATCKKAKGKDNCAKVNEGRKNWVCGSDGRTYVNKCRAKRAGVKVASKGPCTAVDTAGSSSAKRACTCDLEWDPRCGEDGKAYINSCVAQMCAGVRLAPSKRCGLPPVPEGGGGGGDESGGGGGPPNPNPCDMPCIAEYNPVCGTDNTTYGSPCIAKCVGVGIGRMGPCDCDCPDAEPADVVCGSNRQPYPSECFAGCAGALPTTPGACLIVDPVPCSACKDEPEDPVCASDGMTYPSPCHAACFGLDVVSSGKCPPFDPCDSVYSPVCAGGVTYDNPCTAKYAYAPQPWVPGTCECAAKCASEPADPVCGADGVEYPSKCQATCSGTTTAVSKPPCGGPEPPPTGCPCFKDEYSPVCGEDGQTYPNPCIARCYGVTVARDGTCAPQPCNSVYSPVCAGGVTYENPCTAKNANAPQPWVDGTCECSAKCANEPANPVCGADGIEYPSKCQAACSGNTIAVSEPPCGGPEPPPPLCPCPKIYMPVCGEDGQNYPNPCVARCNGVKLAYNGTCAPQPCENEFYSPVCAGGVTYDNPCAAKNANAPQPWVDGICDCSAKCASEPANPVCGADGIEYPSKCQAVCAGKTVPVSEPPCSGPEPPLPVCRCSKIYMPVCGEDGQTYSNPCLALCNGVKLAYNGTCAPQPCAKCPDGGKPVCGNDGVTYSNVCEAKCNGVQSWTPGTCECAASCPEPSDGPVCSSNGQWFGSECAARCAGVKAFVPCKQPPVDECLAVGDVCQLANDECCKGLKCGQYPIAQSDATTGKCWDLTQPLPIG